MFIGLLIGDCGEVIKLEIRIVVGRGAVGSWRGRKSECSYFF